MITFKQYFFESISEKAEVALIPGSFKPPHAGHLDMVKQYSNMAEKVIVIISAPSKKSVRQTSTGKVITPEIAKEIWEIYTDAAKLNNVEVIISDIPSPMRAASEYAEHTDGINSVIFGASKKDDDWKRWSFVPKYFQEHKPEIKVFDIEKYAVEPYENISATDIRNNIDKPEEIRKYLPKELFDEDFQKIVDLLN